MLRGSVVCLGEQKGCAGADCIASVSACLREGSQADNLNEIKTIRFWVRYRKSVGWLSITLPKRFGPEMVQTLLNRRQ